ncbi:MAG: hypothetical protein ACKOKH_05900, partial [Bacteroidota bacterium]
MLVFGQQAFSQTLYTVGTGTASNTTTGYPAAYGNYWWGSRQQYMIRASELVALGATPGNIGSIAFDVATVVATPLQGYTIKMGTTTDTAFTTTAGWRSGLSTVYSGPSTGYVPVSGWNTHLFTPAYFWDGTSNLVIEVCFNNTAYSNNASTRMTATTWNSSMARNADLAGICVDPIITSTYLNRPNMQISITGISGRDLAASALLSPVAPMGAGASAPVTVRLMNTASDPITSATVGYLMTGGSVVTESWSGSLSTGQTANHTFSTNLTAPSSGSFTVQAFVSNANGLGADLNQANDTVSRTIILAIPGGTYTIGASATANYPTVTAAVNAMRQGGITGSINFLIEPGTYFSPTGGYDLSSIIGAGGSTTIGFSSLTGSAADVILYNDTTGTPSSARHTFNITVPGVSFSSLTFA